MEQSVAALAVEEQQGVRLANAAAALSTVNVAVPSQLGAKVELFEVLPVGQSAEHVASRSPGREEKPRPVSKAAQQSVVLPEVPLPDFAEDRSGVCASGRPIIVPISIATMPGITGTGTVILMGRGMHIRLPGDWRRGVLEA